MTARIRVLLCVSGAIVLLALAGLTFLGPFPHLIGVPLFLVTGILYGLEFEKAFWVTWVIAFASMFLFLGIDLYYASQPKEAVVYLLVATAIIALLGKLAASFIKDAEAESLSAKLLRLRKEKREREEREATLRKLIEGKNIKPREGEPAPPWIQFPFYSFFEGLERFGGGPGDDYINKVWGPFWRDRTINQRHEYFQYYDLGEQWPDRDNWYQYWVTWENLELHSDYLKKLVDEVATETHPGEPVPPWIKYPELDDATCDWRQGKGDDYLKQTFLPFFNVLTEGEKVDFLRRHDLGLGWEDRDEWMWLIDFGRDVTRP